MEKLIKYLHKQKIAFTNIGGYCIKINNIVYQLVQPSSGILFDKDFKFVHKQSKGDGFIFNFGGHYYYLMEDDVDDPTLNPLKWIGKAVQEIPTDTFLGVHGSYEILNGSGKYSDWAKKAKFLGVENLGICEKNTLAGVMKFQKECLEEDIHPIIGGSYTVYRDFSGIRYDVKLFVIDFTGWINLLDINKAINFDNNLTEGFFLDHIDGLIIIVDPKTMDYDNLFPLDLHNENLFYQFDTVEYKFNADDNKYLHNLKKFATDKRLRPVPMTDAYYLDKEDDGLKIKLNAIRKKYDKVALNQYFKNKEDYFYEVDDLVNDVALIPVFEEMLKNEAYIAHVCQFNIDTGKRHLPEYSMTKEEAKKFKTNEDLFWHLIEKGLEDKCPSKKLEEYINRIDKEVYVLRLGGVIDYFLITWDIISWANRNGKLSGFGRGSAGGSLVSYMLGIIKLNPLDFDLLFERFLTPERATVSLPDIDSDFCSKDRDSVKQYMEQRFGETQVCSVGTYTTLQVKAGIKDLFRQVDSDFEYVNMMTGIISKDVKNFTDLIKQACKEPKLKRFVKENPDVVNGMKSLHGQPKAKSVHACAMIIFPKEHTMDHWVPTYKRKKDGLTLTEWEGEELDYLGFLKQDILGVKQLDKMSDILKLVEKNYNKEIDIYTIPIDNKDVFTYCSRGWNGDVFQFGSKGLNEYIQQLKPENLNDLIAGVALYRPGAMENNFHNEYILRKNGRHPVEYMWGTEKITKTTYGILIYQEQIMKVCVNVGGFTLIEADSIRKAMGKKKLSVLLPWEKKFKEGAIANGCPEDEVNEMWSTMLEFAKYSFNLSHSVAYAITGYAGQWLKVHYPLEYWHVAFDYADKEDVPNYMSEIGKSGDIKVLPPDINTSDRGIRTELKANSIYWGLTSIKGIGDVAVNQLISDRNINGKYSSLSNFLERSIFKGSKVNKTTVEGLILSGAFDELESIKSPPNRSDLVKMYWEKCKVVVKDDKNYFLSERPEWWFKLKQKSLSGIAYFDYMKLKKESGLKGKYCDSVIYGPMLDCEFSAATGGYVISCEKKRSKKGVMLRIVLENNYDFIPVTVWPDDYKRIGTAFDGCKGSLMLISGNVKYDTYSRKNVLQTGRNTDVITLKLK